jgi:hypothetical protein
MKERTGDECARVLISQATRSQSSPGWRSKVANDAHEQLEREHQPGHESEHEQREAITSEGLRTATNELDTDEQRHDVVQHRVVARAAAKVDHK